MRNIELKSCYRTLVDYDETDFLEEEAFERRKAYFDVAFRVGKQKGHLAIDNLMEDKSSLLLCITENDSWWILLSLLWCG